MTTVTVYTVRSRRGVHLRTLRIEEAVGHARRLAHRPPFVLPSIEQTAIEPVDHTAKEAA